MAKDKSKDLKINPNQSAEEKAKALATAIGQIEKQFGKGAVMRFGQNQSLNVGPCTGHRRFAKRKNRRNLWP